MSVTSGSAPRAASALALFMIAATSPAQVNGALLVPDAERPIVNVLVGSDPLPRKFIVDTAATQTVFDRAYATEHQLSATVGQVTVEGATGGASFDRVLAPSLRIGNADFRGREVVTNDLSRYRGNRPYAITGVLGSDFFGKAGATFEPATGNVEFAARGFSTGSCMRNEASADVSGLTIVDLRLERDGHWIALRGVIDSGAPQTIINSRALEALGLSTSSPKVHQSGMVTKGFATASSGRVTWTTHLQNIGIAGWTSGPFETRISDAPVFGVIGLSDKPGAIVGYDVLKRARFGLLPRLRGFCIEAARRNRSR